MATKIRASNLHTDVKTMVTTMVGENALDSAEANLLIDAKFTANSTDVLSEGSTNLYFTNARADARAQLKVDAIVGSAPGTLDTLQELGDALGDDPNFATTVTNSIATKLPLAGGTLTGNVTFGDNNKVIFGAGSDANIRHDGANTKFSHTGSGGLYLGADLLAIQNSAHNETFLSATANGAVTLYHDNSAKLATTSTGIDVTGSGVPTITLTSSSGPYSYIESNTVGSLGFAADEGNTGSSTNINFRVDGNEIARLNGGSFVVNDGSRDIDFRVESNNNTSMLFVDAGNDRISVGSGSTYSMFNVISSNDNTSDWWTNNVATQYMQNTVGHTVLKMNNNNSNRSAYLVYNGNGSAQGFHIFDRQNEQSRISAYASSVVINEPGEDVDFRVESDNNTHMLFVDAGSNEVGIGTSDPRSPLHVQTSHSSTDVTAANTNSTLSIGNNAVGNGIYNAIKFAAHQQDMYIMSFNNAQVADRRLGFFLGSSAGDAVADERLSIRGNGNVGIGTNDPKRHLQIGATGSFPISFNGNYPDIHMNTYYESGWRIHTAGFGAKTTFNGATGAFGFSNVASSQSAGATFTPLERLTILANGNVGINNNNPSQRLTVNSPGGAGAGAAGKFSEVMAQIHETGGQTESGRRSIMFFNDINNWYNGTEKTVFGMAFNNNGSIRGGIQYDHKNTERMTIWSGYGPIEFKVPSVTNQGDYRADQVDLTPLTIENLTGSVRINNQKPSTAVNITEAQSIYSLSLKNRDNGTRLSFSGDTTLSSTIQSMNPNNNGAAHIKLNPFGGKTVIGTYDEVGHNNDLTVDSGIYIQNGVPSTSQYVANAVIPKYAITFPVTPGITAQNTSAGNGWGNIGWQPTARSGEVMHRQTTNRYMVNGTGNSLGFYIEAGTSEAGGICLDEDSVQVYGSSDNGTTFRIIDKDSDIVIMEMLQSSWNMSVRGSVNSSQSSFSGLSDRRVKKSFQDVSTENILTKYNNLDLKSYIRIDSYDYMKDNYENEEDLREIGLVAQEVEEIFPDVVGTTPVVDPRGMDSVWEELGEELTEIKNINQTGLLYKTIEAVQALIEENTALKARIAALEE